MRAYHSLGHSLKIIRYIKDNSGDDFSWREEVYEFRADLPAIELLAGDPVLLDYLYGTCDFKTVRQALADAEETWIKKAKDYLLYPAPLYRIALDPANDYP